jgi:hypothetical protein
MSLPEKLEQQPLPKVLPPLVIFGYRRPDKLKLVLEAIKHQTVLPEKIIAFIDGPAEPETQTKVDKCLQCLREFDVVQIDIRARECNLGCRQNILQGIDEILANNDSIVVLEDDTVPSPAFYETMCRLLNSYKPFKKIFSITGYNALHATDYVRTYPIGGRKLLQKLKTDMFLTNRFSTWGWATWGDRWNEIREMVFNVKHPYGSFHKIPLLLTTFDTVYIAYYFARPGQQSSRWGISVFLAVLYKGCYTLTPRFSMINNIGFGDIDAAHNTRYLSWVNDLYCEDYVPETLPESLDLLPEFEKPLSPMLVMYFIVIRIFGRLRFYFQKTVARFLGLKLVSAQMRDG